MRAPRAGATAIRAPASAERAMRVIATIVLYRRPMSHEPHIQTRVETGFHFSLTILAMPYVMRLPNPATSVARAMLPASHCPR